MHDNEKTIRTHRQKWCVGSVGVKKIRPLFSKKNGEEQEQTSGNPNWSETSLIKVDSF